MGGALRSLAKKILPWRFVDWYRRRRALRRYFRTLSLELYHRQSRMGLEELEGRIASRRQGFYQGLVKDVLERTDLVLQELDRRIEGLGVRHGTQLRQLQEDVADLRAAVEGLREQVQRSAQVPSAGE